MVSVPAEMDTLIAGANNRMMLIDHRSKDSFEFACEVTQPRGALESMLAWCRSELTGDWRWQLVDMSSHQRPGNYIFYFDSDRDCCAFSLKWC